MRDACLPFLDLGPVERRAFSLLARARAFVVTCISMNLRMATSTYSNSTLKSKVLPLNASAIFFKPRFEVNLGLSVQTH